MFTSNSLFSNEEKDVKAIDSKKPILTGPLVNLIAEYADTKSSTNSKGMLNLDEIDTALVDKKQFAKKIKQKILSVLREESLRTLREKLSIHHWSSETDMEKARAHYSKLTSRIDKCIDQIDLQLDAWLYRNEISRSTLIKNIEESLKSLQEDLFKENIEWEGKNVIKIKQMINNIFVFGSPLLFFNRSYELVSVKGQSVEEVESILNNLRQLK